MADESYPQELKYYKEHDWVRVDGEDAVFGITWFAQDALGEIVYADLPAVGDEVTAGSPYGELESVKAVSDVFAPLTGEVVEVNDALAGRAAARQRRLLRRGLAHPRAHDARPASSASSWTPTPTRRSSTRPDVRARRHRLRPAQRRGRARRCSPPSAASSVDELFADIPEDVRRREPLALPAGLSEVEVLAELRRARGRGHAGERASSASSAPASTTTTCRPSSTRSSAASEFLTAYTPYQPERSQGVLQTHLRVPDGDLRAHRHGRQQRLACTTPARRWPRPRCSPAARRGAGGSCCQRRRAPRVPAGAGHRDGRARAAPAGRRPAGGRGHRPRRAAGAPSTPTRPPSSCSSPTSSAPSRTSPPRREIAHEAGALFVVVADPLSLGLLEAPGAARRRHRRRRGAVVRQRHELRRPRPRLHGRHAER